MDVALSSQGVTHKALVRVFLSLTTISLNKPIAVMHNVVSKLDGGLKSKLAGVALFGDTRNKQDGGHIPNFPAANSKVWCNASDGVCGGGLNVNAGHLSYSNAQIKEAANYLAQRVKSHGGGGGGHKEGGTSGHSEGKAKAPKAKANFADSEEAGDFEDVQL